MQYNDDVEQYEYWLTARVLAAALRHWPDWEPYLAGPWCASHQDVGKPQLAGWATITKYHSQRKKNPKGS